MSRVESPHSINVYKACPRKYYYRYHLNLPEKTSIAAVNGNIVHSTLEQFFQFEPTRLGEKNAYDELRYHLLNAFHEQWVRTIPKLSALDLEKEEVKEYYKASLEMLENFFQNFAERLKHVQTELSVQEAFVQLTPETEVHLHSETLQLQGYVDAIHHAKGESIILDYKTSRSDEVSEGYRLQLALYALLFQEKFGVLPTKIGLYFLRKNTEKFLELTQELIEEAATVCREVHAKTSSKNIEDYPKNVAQHCRYCDYQVVCFGQKSLQEFQDEQREEQAKGLNPDVEADLSVGR